MYTDTYVGFNSPGCLKQHTHTAVKTSRWTKREGAAPGALRPFREMSDFISSFKLSAPTHPIWQWLVYSLEEPLHQQRLIKAEPTNRPTSGEGGETTQINSYMCRSFGKLIIASTLPDSTITLDGARKYEKHQWHECFPFIRQLKWYRTWSLFGISATLGHTKNWAIMSAARFTAENVIAAFSYWPGCEEN